MHTLELTPLQLREERASALTHAVGTAAALVAGIVRQFTAADDPADWELESAWTELRGYYPVSVSIEDVEAEYGGRANLTRENVEFELQGDIHAAYTAAVEALNANPVAISQLGDSANDELQRRVVLSTVDRLWREHLYEVDYLKEGIGLRAMGQRDPLVEYKDEASKMFQAMMERIREESVQQLFAYHYQFEKANEQREELIASGGGDTSVASEPGASGQVDAASQAKTPAKPAKSQVKAQKKASTPKTVMGDVGRQSVPNRLTMQGPAKQSEPAKGTARGPAVSAGAGGQTLNRAQRRAQSKKKR